MNDIITYYFIFCFISVLIAAILKVIIYLYKRHRKKAFVTRYRIEEDVYKIDRNINGDVMKTYSYFVICRVISPWESWYLDFRIKKRCFTFTNSTAESLQKNSSQKRKRRKESRICSPTQTNTYWMNKKDILCSDERYIVGIDLAYDKPAFEQLLKHGVRLGDDTLLVRELIAFSSDSGREQPSPERVSPS